MSSQFLIDSGSPLAALHDGDRACLEHHHAFRAFHLLTRGPGEALLAPLSPGEAEGGWQRADGAGRAYGVGRMFGVVRLRVCGGGRVCGVGLAVCVWRGDDLGRRALTRSEGAAARRWARLCWAGAAVGRDGAGQG